MFFSINYKGNSKTGRMPVTSTSSDSCPKNCAWYETGCYAKNHHSKTQWARLDAGELKENLFDSIVHLCYAIKAFNSQYWRLNEKGDITNEKGDIRFGDLRKITEANSVNGKKGFTYTHALLTKDNIDAIKSANENGFTVNYSADTYALALQAYGEGLPVTMVVHSGTPKETMISSVRVIICPNQSNKKITCIDCKLCANGKRDYIIGFRAHGSQKNKVNAKLELINAINCDQ